MPLEDIRAVNPNTSVRSATFDPSSVPSPSSGTPSSAENMEMDASGNAEIRAITKKLTTNSERFSIFAKCVAYVVQ